MPIAIANLEEEIVRELEDISPVEVFTRRIAANNRRVLGPELENGRDIAEERTAIYCALMAHWAAREHRAWGYDRPFAVVALGGTGRGEMTPCSDTDFALLFDDSLEENPFLRHLQGQLAETGTFAQGQGFSCQPLPFNLQDIPALDHKQLNSFLDMRPVYDPSGLSALFRTRLRATYDPFLHFLYVHRMWKAQCEKDGADCESLQRFDVKMDGLRSFLAGVWVLAGKTFVPCRNIYELLGDSRDLEAYHFLLRIRSFIHLLRGTNEPSLGMGRHAEDILAFEDFTSFGRMLGPEAGERERFDYANRVRARLLSARRRVMRFSRGVISHELRGGRTVSPGSPIVYGWAGLRRSEPAPRGSVRDRSHAALELLVAAQRYDLPIDPAELDGVFHEAGDWLVQTPDVAELFYEPNGSLADSFAFLAQLDGAEDRLFPGHAKFEVSLDERVRKERSTLRGALVRRKIHYLESFLREGRQTLSRELSSTRGVLLGESDPVPVVAATLDGDQVAAIKLALKTKRLPLTGDDADRKADETLSLDERFSSGFSGIPLRDYYRESLSGCGFPEEMVRITEFLVENRKAFKTAAQAGPRDQQAVQEFAELCGSEGLLKTLYVFTCADRSEWESEREDPVLWFNIRELYAKTLSHFQPRLDPEEALRSAGYSHEELLVLRDFNRSLLVGGYGQYGLQLGEHLARLALDPDRPGPKARLVRKGVSIILAVAARDYPGLAASISGALWHAGVSLRQAHLFSSETYRVALDFFHLAPSEDHPLPDGLLRTVEEAIACRAHIGDEVRAELPTVGDSVTLSPWRSTFRLSAETRGDVGGLIYALTYHVFRDLRGNVHGLSAQIRRGKAAVEVYFQSRNGMDLGEAIEEVRNWGREAAVAPGDCLS